MKNIPGTYRILQIRDDNIPYAIRMTKENYVFQNELNAALGIYLTSRPIFRINYLFDLKLTFENKILLFYDKFYKYFFYQLQQFIFPLHLTYFIYLIKAIRTFKPNILIVKDIHYFLPVYICAKVFKIKLILDLYESSIGQTAISSRLKFPLKQIKIMRLRITEQFAVIESDKIVVVIEERKKNIVQKYKIPKDKIIVVPNSELLKAWESMPTYQIKDDENIISYIGDFTNERGLPTLIEAVSILKKRGRLKVKLILAGAGLIENKIKDLVKRLNLNDWITFTGWINFRETKKIIENSKIGIIPHINTEFIKNTIPNKLYQYMTSRRPVIVSNVGPLERIVKENNCGFVFKAGSPENLALKIEELIIDKKKCLELGENGYKAMKNKYDWLIVSKKYIKLIQDLLHK